MTSERASARRRTWRRLVKQRRLLSHLSWLVQPRQSLGQPKISKLFDRRRSVARIVVVGVGEHNHATLPHLVAKIYPTAEFTSAINNGPIPRRCLLLDTFAITEPPDVRPVGSDRVKFQFCRTWHE